MNPGAIQKGPGPVLNAVLRDAAIGTLEQDEADRTERRGGAVTARLRDDLVDTVRNLRWAYEMGLRDGFAQGVLAASAEKPA